jgi:hypothetical protein
MGPYKVSFYLGNVGPYRIISSDGSEKDTLQGIPYTEYFASIIDMDLDDKWNYSIFLYISEYKEPMEGNDENLVRSMLEKSSERSSERCGEPTIVTRTIDGKPGVVGSMTCHDPASYFDSTSYAIAYSLDTMSQVYISSAYPWYWGTSNLVKTIHIEKK